MSRLQINRDLCNLCEKCILGCPFAALEIAGEKLTVNDNCVLCGACIELCPMGALSIVEERVAERPDVSAFSGVWVYAELANGKIHPVTFELIGKGRELVERRGGKLSAVLIGADLGQAVKPLKRSPLDRIYVIEDGSLRLFRSETYAAALAELIEKEKPEIVLCGATGIGRSFFPRAAALVRTGLTADCTGLEIDAQQGLLLQTRPAFGGNIMATITCPRHRPQMATVRPKVLPTPAPGPERDVEVVRFTPSAGALRAPVEVLDIVVEESGVSSIAEADVIVAGGRGVGSAEGFELLRGLALELGGAVGASRSAVDSGWTPYSHQVGQTGKTVQPKLYIACGISGAIQHLVGMQTADVILAVNSDPNAPIFSVATYGIVGDLYQVVPALVKEFQSRLGAGALS